MDLQYTTWWEEEKRYEWDDIFLIPDKELEDFDWEDNKQNSNL